MDGLGVGHFVKVCLMFCFLLDVGFGFEFGFGFGFIGTDVDGKGLLILVPQGGVSSVWISQQVSSVS